MNPSATPVLDLVVVLVSAVSLAVAPGAARAAGGSPAPDLCDRDCWGARAPTSTAAQMPGLNRAVIHHTAGANEYDTQSLEESAANVRAVQAYHMDVNGWSDIGYHFLADSLGYAFEGREGSIDSLPRGAHDGVNDKSMGFSMMGYFHEPYDQEPTIAQRCTIYELIAWKVPDPFTGYGAGAYGSKSQVGYVAGHRDVGSTACPGDLMYDPYIALDFYAGEAREEVATLIDGGGGLCDGGPLCCPGAPTLDAVQGVDGGIEVRWSDGGDVTAYRVWVSVDGGPASAVEVPGGTTSWLDTDAAPLELRAYSVTAVGTLSESAPSDTYAARLGEDAAQVLVVDGDDRWVTQPENPSGLNHAFAASAGAALPVNLPFDTADNAAVEAGRVALGGYAAAVWTLGEESTTHETFSAGEQAAVDAWLAAGGSLFVSGAEVGWDLWARGGTDDQGFYTYSLRAAYVADDAGVSQAHPVAGGIFDGLGALDFSAGPMIIDYPDAIAPGPGAVAQLYYTAVADGDAQELYAGLSYQGLDRVVYLGFPVEALAAASRSAVLARVVDFFGVVGEDGGAESVHVRSVRGALVGRGQRQATAEVSLVDGDGAPVPGTRVTGTFSGGVSATATADAGRRGIALLSVPAAGATSFTFCVESVSAQGRTWLAAADEARCVTVGGP